jgi:hypothetical protein
MTKPDTIRRINAERTIPLDRYRDEGADSRYEYLVDLADFNGIPLDAVLTMVDVLGPDEDFDGLVSMAEDLSLMGGLE